MMSRNDFDCAISMSESLKATIKGALPLTLFVAGLLLLVYLIVIPGKKDVKEQPPAIQVAADQLSQAYSSNENLANETYYDKILSVTGAIIETGSEEAGQPYVLLQGAGSGHPDIQCVFPSSDVAPIIQSIKKGQNVTLAGRCQGGQFRIILLDCRLIQ
jgi:hypothetical protein